MRYPRDYLHHASLPFPAQDIWVREDDDVAGPFTAVGVLDVLAKGDPDKKHTRYHVVIVGAAGRSSVPAELVVWSGKEAKAIATAAAERAKDGEAAERAAVEAERKRKIAEAEVVLKAVKG